MSALIESARSLLSIKPDIRGAPDVRKVLTITLHTVDQPHSRDLS